MELPVIKTVNDLDRLEWTVNPHHRMLELKFKSATGSDCSVYLSQRQGYCDRGHFQVNINMPGYFIDYADGFPRYYMSLQRAKEEVIDFLKWRMFKVRVNKEVIDSTPSLLEVMIESHVGE